MKQSPYDDRLGPLKDAALEEFTAKHQAREEGLRISREVIRLSANSIRATHRLDFDQALELLAQAEQRHVESKRILDEWPEIYHAGFLSDARKEFTEANITVALIAGRPVPTPESLGVEMAPYLNGMGEVIGELRTVHPGLPAQE